MTTDAKATQNAGTPVEGEAQATPAAVVKQTPVAVTQADLNALKSTHDRQMADMEKRLKVSDERAQAAGRYRDDPDAFQKWEAEFNDREAASKWEGERNALLVQNAILKAQRDFPGVPDTAFNGVQSSMEAENRALLWAMANRSATVGAAPAAEQEEETPTAPKTFIGGGAGAATTSNDAFLAAQAGAVESRDLSPIAKKRELEIAVAEGWGPGQ
jgi:hypothetical protein